MQSLNCKNNEKTHKNVVLLIINLDITKKSSIFASSLTILKWRHTINSKQSYENKRKHY